MVGGATVVLDLPNEDIPRRDINVELETTAAPTAGLLLEPLEGLRFGLCWRDELGLELALPILFDNGETLDFEVAVDGVALWVPMQLSFGASVDLDKLASLPLLLSFDVIWDRWSTAPSPELNVVIDVQGDAVEGLGFEEGLDFSPGPVPPAGFEDTLTLRFGAETRVTDAFALRAGYAYRPSALVPQTGFTNYVDADAHIIGSGGSVTFRAPLEINENPVTIAVGIQYTRLAEVQVDKAAAGPVPSYKTSGNLLALSLTVSHDF